MKITCEFNPMGYTPTYANSIKDYAELYLGQLSSVLMLASIGSPTHIDFLLKTELQTYSKYRKIAAQPEKLKQKLNLVNSITKAYISIVHGDVLIRFVNAQDNNVDVHVVIAQSDLLQAMRNLKSATL